MAAFVNLGHPTLADERADFIFAQHFAGPNAAVHCTNQKQPLGQGRLTNGEIDHLFVKSQFQSVTY
jgi:hypothetical protein